LPTSLKISTLGGLLSKNGETALGSTRRNKNDGFVASLTGHDIEIMHNLLCLCHQ